MHTATLLVELGAILLALSVLAVPARRLGFSPIPLYLLAGLAFGRGGLLPLEASADFVSTGAEVGLVLLLFGLGLAFSPAELLGGLRRHSGDGLVDLALGAAPGAAAGLLLGWGMEGSIVLAGVTAVSSSGIIVGLLGDLGRLANRETPILLAILVIEDLAMAAYLPVVTTLLAGSSGAAAALQVAGAVTAASVVLVAATRWHGRATVLLGPASSSDQALILRTLGLALLCAGVAERLHISAAVGAFLVGVALSGPIAERAGDLLTPLRELFAAVFFVVFGLQLDPALIPGVAFPAALLALASVGGKGATGWIAGRRAGLGTAARRRLGSALTCHGEFSIVIAGLAVSAGAAPDLGPLVATYVLLLAVVGPVLTRFAGGTRTAVTVA